MWLVHVNHLHISQQLATCVHSEVGMGGAGGGAGSLNWRGLGGEIWSLEGAHGGGEGGCQWERGGGKGGFGH